MSSSDDAYIIALDKFIMATRDSGYRGTPNAIAELIDNAIQAGAEEVRVDLGAKRSEGPAGPKVVVLDNGCGMNSATLRQALRFGGSTRFNDRKGIGRFGMGLPNASLSQARRLDVYTWQRGKRPLHSYLDVDEIARGHLRLVPPPRRTRWPSSVDGWSKGNGTLVEWSRCDRLDNKRASTVARKLIPFIGRVFRYFIWDGIRIVVNGEMVQAVDPLYLHRSSAVTGGRMFGEPLAYEIETPDEVGDSGRVGKVHITFSELPVQKWHGLPNEEKRRLGILNGAGVSIVRAGREIDYGWFFLGGKRRENYDDWWRCEIRFEPVLDGLFGLAHTKQQIRPTEYLTELLAPDMEAIARTLNSRVRKGHLAIKAREQLSRVEHIATERDGLLKPLPRCGTRHDDERAIRRLMKKHPSLATATETGNGTTTSYAVIEDRLKGTDLFRVLRGDGRLVLVLNPDHPFHKRVYKPLADSENQRDVEMLCNLQLLLLSAARASVSPTGRHQQDLMRDFLHRWSDVLATFLNG